MTTHPEQPVRLSFIVPAYNEERLLGQTLAAIHAAARALGERYEVIVVDDGSTDRTASVARAGSARVIRACFRQIARTRNAGARAAAGSTLIFVDADTVVSARTLRATLRALEHGAVGGGARIEVEGRLPIWARLMLVLVRGVLQVGHMAAGCYVFCSRAAFDRVGGFDERLYAAEELAFSWRLRRVGRVVLLSEGVVTSGRKLRTHSGWELIGLLADFSRRGVALLRSPTRLSIWYGDRRDDPDSGPDSQTIGARLDG